MRINEKAVLILKTCSYEVATWDINFDKTNSENIIHFFFFYLTSAKKISAK